ncbi:hypothetical protein SAMN05444487_1256 [Marininema mesophilum]|uniref:YCII-related domain-containing protein n=1 Tax=Marininema mesophilum TaxID=1048340 RepID=A0A1H3CPH0_9BACL|nr:YciI family protein [Marininema mesophilum]SDX55930.1 hypothetical protein SAMN05444487_1256 [Marininema mesophilum]
MKTYVAFLSMLDEEKSAQFRGEHLAYLEQMNKDGHIFAYGRFQDGSGGMVIYQAETLDEAKGYATADPFIKKGARKLDIKEWAMTPGAVQ